MKCGGGTLTQWFLLAFGKDVWFLGIIVKIKNSADLAKKLCINDESLKIDCFDGK